MKKNIKQRVKEGYGKIALQGGSCCSSSSCCGASSPAKDTSKTVGHSDAEINAVPEGANLGLGCGNPVAIASLKEGQTVLDLGSGAGFDAFLAAQKVGKTGLVIGVNMTPEMIERARKNAEKGGYSNVEFRLGEIEKLPEAVRESVEAYVGCLAGAMKKDEYLNLISLAGFREVKVMSESGYPVDALFDGLESAQDAIRSIKVSALKK